MRVLGADDSNDEGRNLQTAIVAGAGHSKLSSKSIGLWLWLSSAERGRYEAFLDRIRRLAQMDVFRHLHRGATFWCGLLLGGCGGQLTTKLYLDRVCSLSSSAC